MISLESLNHPEVCGLGADKGCFALGCRVEGNGFVWASRADLLRGPLVAAELRILDLFGCLARCLAFQDPFQQHIYIPLSSALQTFERVAKL